MRNTTVDSLKPGPTLIEQAYDAILAAIGDGRLAPGARLNHDDLAARMGISRQPVGQALSILKAQGFVRDTGRRGLIVAPIEREFFRAVYELREALDSLAASLAAQRSTPRDAAEGKTLIAEGREAVKSGRTDLLVEADVRFHLWLCKVAGNPLLADTLRLYWHHLRRAMNEVLQDTERHPGIWDEHEAIFDAVVARDATEAGRLATAHARAAGKDVARSMPAAPAGLGKARGIVSLSDELPPSRPAATRRRKSSP
jgi:DNA-binding GntR family transcriptional regulator